MRKQRSKGAATQAEGTTCPKAWVQKEKETLEFWLIVPERPDEIRIVR